jgi:hypothetical protein
MQLPWTANLQAKKGNRLAEMCIEAKRVANGRLGIWPTIYATVFNNATSFAVNVK